MNKMNTITARDEAPSATAYDENDSYRAEKGSFLPQTVYDHTYHIEQGYYQSGKGQHHVGVSGYFRVICTAQMNDQQTDDITQNQTSRVPINNLCPLLALPNTL